jgi:hypothetical protein
MKSYDPIPTIKGFTDYYNKRITIWCPECKTWHLHGVGIGNRTPHCYYKQSRYHDQNDYLIKPYTKTDLLKFKDSILDMLLTNKEKQAIQLTRRCY